MRYEDMPKNNWSVDENGKAVRSVYGWPSAKIAFEAQKKCKCDGPFICGWCCSLPPRKR